jgi:hypothetical protein
LLQRSKLKPGLKPSVKQQKESVAGVMLHIKKRTGVGVGIGVM